jgi:hypothetical protein
MNYPVALVVIALSTLYAFYGPCMLPEAESPAKLADYQDFVKALREAACTSDTKLYDVSHHCYGYQAPNVDTCKIGVGFASDVDYIVRAETLLKKLTPPETDAHHEHIVTMEDLIQTFAHHFNSGAAGEYSV